MVCELKVEGDKNELMLRLMFDDKMERELCSDIKEGMGLYRTQNVAPPVLVIGVHFQFDPICMK